MPKGKRTRDYEREIEEAAKRMRKHPESLRSARDSETWLNFLYDLDDFNPYATYTEKGGEFWEKVRTKTAEGELSGRSAGFTERGLAEQGAVIKTYERTTKTGRTYTVSRIVEYGTNKFANVDNLERR